MYSKLLLYYNTQSGSLKLKYIVKTKGSVYPMRIAPAGNSVSTKITYDTARIRDTGQQIVQNAGAAYDLHDPARKLVVMPYLELTPMENDGRRPLEYAMKLHIARIQAAYDWQLALGNTLKRIADAIDQNEMIIKNTF